MQQARFIKRPRTLEELQRPNAIGILHSYRIVGEIVLSAIDYENFATDLLADREFLENASLCRMDEPVLCLLVRTRAKNSGILVVPERKCFVSWAAWWNEE